MESGSSRRGNNRGGKQPNAGRKAGRPAMTIIKPQPKPKPQPPIGLGSGTGSGSGCGSGSGSKSKAKLETFIDLMARGFTFPQMKDRGVALALSTYKRYKADPNIQYAIRQRRDEILGDKRELYEGFLPEAIQSYSRLLESDTPAIATDVLHQLVGKPLVRQNIDSRMAITIELKPADDRRSIGELSKQYRVVDLADDENEAECSGDPMVAQ